MKAETVPVFSPSEAAPKALPPAMPPHASACPADAGCISPVRVARCSDSDNGGCRLDDCLHHRAPDSSGHVAQSDSELRRTTSARRGRVTELNRPDFFLTSASRKSLAATVPRHYRSAAVTGAARPVSPWTSPSFSQERATQTRHHQSTCADELHPLHPPPFWIDSQLALWQVAGSFENIETDNPWSRWSFQHRLDNTSLSEVTGSKTFIATLAGHLTSAAVRYGKPAFVRLTRHQLVTPR